jgi:Holliday junction DNA helicase RuvA
MIAHIFGNVAEKFGGAIIVDVMGVGYEINVAANDYDAVKYGDDVKFYTYHHIREQSQELFGFSTLAAKKLFEMLITVQGVGPKAALSILSLDVAENVRNAIANADSAYLAKAAGVGKKTAERVTVDLSDKVGLPTTLPGGGPVTAREVATADEAMEALMSLGYTLNDAITALDSVPMELPTAERVRRALKGN